MKLWLSSFVFLLSAFSMSCTLKVPNVPVCADKGRLGAVCAYTLGDEEILRLNRMDWDKKRVGWFCMDAKAYGDYKTFIEMACQQDKHCIAGVRRILELENK